VTPEQVGEQIQATLDVPAMLLADHIRDAIWTGAATSSRSLQASIGASEIGNPCDRRKAYRSVVAPPVNFPDPQRALIGTGLHEALSAIFVRLDGGTHRYLVESQLTYRGIPGTADLFDRRRGVVIDWKSSTKAKIRQIRADGPQQQYVVQAQFYGAALAATGEHVREVALAFVPLDGTLADIYVWRADLDTAVADAWIDAYLMVADMTRDLGPGAITARPSRLCPWCPWYRPGSIDANLSCPGAEPKAAPGGSQPSDDPFA
jgi:hypothetical protein